MVNRQDIKVSATLKLMANLRSVAGVDEEQGFRMDSPTPPTLQYISNHQTSRTLYGSYTFERMYIQTCTDLLKLVVPSMEKWSTMWKVIPSTT